MTSLDTPTQAELSAGRAGASADAASVQPGTLKSGPQPVGPTPGSGELKGDVPGVSLRAGEPVAAGVLLPVVYAELRKLAAAKMAREPAGHTLQPTALVHEAWLRLGGPDDRGWQGQAHFFAAAAEAMRRILIERARRKSAVRHGGGLQRVEVDELPLACPIPDDQLLALDEALDKLAAQHPRQAEVVKLRYFVGMTLREVAEVLNISLDTAKDDSAYARAWLFQKLNRAGVG